VHSWEWTLGAWLREGTTLPSEYTSVIARYRGDIIQTLQSLRSMHRWWPWLGPWYIFKSPFSLNHFYLSLTFQQTALELHLDNILHLVVVSLRINELEGRWIATRDREREGEFVLTLLNQMILKLLASASLDLSRWAKLEQFLRLMKHC